LVPIGKPTGALHPPATHRNLAACSRAARQFRGGVGGMPE